MRPSKRRILIAAGAAGAALLILWGGLWLARVPIAGAIGRAVLERRGISAEFDIVQLDTSRLVLRDVRLSDGTAIPQLELDYRLGELIGGRIRAVRLTRPQITIDLTEDDISIAGFRIGRPAGDGAGGAPRVGLVSVTNGLVTLASAEGDLPVELELEGGPAQGWRGWATAESGSVGWRGWRADVQVGEAEFEMIGDGLLARVSVELAGATGPRGGADTIMAAATVRMTGLEQGFANAQGEAALNAALAGVRATEPEAEARRLIVAQRWEGVAGIGPFATPLAQQLGAALAQFDAQAALMADITPETVSIALQSPVTLDSANGPDLAARPLDDPQAGLVFSYGRDGRGWRVQTAVTVAGGPALDARVLDIRFAPDADGRSGLAALRFEGDLAPFGDDAAMLGAEALSLEWTRTETGWGAASSGAARFSGAGFGLAARDAALNGAFKVTLDDGAVQVRPGDDGGLLDIRAANFDTEAARFEGLSLRLSPVLDVAEGRWLLAPGDNAVSMAAERIGTETMRLSGVALEAPQGGLALEGEGGVFELSDGAPLRVSMEEASSPAWTARGVRSARVNGAGGPLLQRTEAGETFLNAGAETMQAESFELVSDTDFRQIAAQDVRLRGAVTPEMNLDVAAPTVSAILDTLGRTDMALTAGEVSASLSAAPGAPLSMGFSLADGALAGGTLPVALSRARARGRAAFGAQLSADIEIENAVVVPPGERPVVTPATLSGGLTAGGGVVRMDLAGAVEGAPAGAIQIALTHNLLTGLGEANVDLPRIVFTPGGTQPQDIIPPLKGFVADVSGPAEARFHAEWYGARMRSNGYVVLDNLDVATRFGPLEDVSTRFEMSSLAPLLTPAPQVVTMGRFNPGVPIEGGEVRVSLLPERRIGLDSARWPFAGGAIAVEPLVWDPAETEHRASLLAEQINLAQLIGLFGNESLNAGGTVSGRMPLLISGGNIEIEDARLTGDEEGFVSYRGPASDAAAQANEQANLAFRALENLRYRVLDVTLDGPVAGEMDLAILMEGFNPDVLNGYPFRFRIGLSAEFIQLIRDTTQGFRIRQQIERSLQEGAAEPIGGPPPAESD